jgi:hypothetical protein
MSATDAAGFRRFVLAGGAAPLHPGSFAPCLSGSTKTIAGVATLQYDIAAKADQACFRH